MELGEQLEKSFNAIFKALHPGDSQFYHLEVTDALGTLVYNPTTREFGKKINFGSHSYDGVSAFKAEPMSREVKLYESVRKNEVQIIRVPKQIYREIYPEKILIKFGHLE